MFLANKKIYFFSFLAYVLTNLHLLRNITSFFAVATIGILGIVTFLIFWRGLTIHRQAILPLVILFACMTFSIMNSYISFPEESYLDKIPRFLLTLPFLFIGAVLSPDQFRKFLLTCGVFGALGALSLIVQIAIGPISWFAEASERGGLFRYASILGSLTIFGTFAGIALSAVYFIKGNNILRFTVIFFVVIGCILSLQKAAILNLLIFVVIVCFGEIKNKRYFAISMAIFTLLFVGLFLALYFGDYFQIALNSFFRTDDSLMVDDVNAIDGLIERIWALPSRLYVDYGFQGMLIGVGLVGGSGALGFPDFPMAHNFIFDMLFIGGFPYFFAYCFILASTFYILCRLRKIAYDIDTASLYCMFFFIINLPATTGTQFHPVISSIVNLIIGFYFISPFRIRKIKNVLQ